MGSSSFAYKSIIFAMVVMMGMSLMVTVFGVANNPLNTDEVLKGYYDFTGAQPASESVWVLSGIYTPYGTDADGNPDPNRYGYTEDGWLYGTSINTYTPSQYGSTVQAYTVSKLSGESLTNNGVFRYTADTQYGDHKAGDLYTNVTMDVYKQSDIFFSPDLKKETTGGFFYYEYTGYRYAFQPTADYNSISADGDAVPVIRNTSSLSLIWYNYYTSTGISGQLIISGQDKSVAYLTAAEIITAFNSTTSTAKFTLNFTGIPMNLYIRLDPTIINSGVSIKDCYELGYWSVMVTSKSADASAYTGADYGLNPANLWQTMVDLFTFNMSAYGFEGSMGQIASLLFVAPLYAMLVAIMIDKGWQMWVAVGVLVAIQAIASFISNPGSWSFLGGLF